ncbi:hypothetical protein SKAU_G00065540 [Synaphobranchus kaupii]|uniref:Uncharacterized protein n=1 Tax=Synaphobranchus kaupii TaxID=118154 RepID=A0A9Q1J910_SYNKA|nr:hypothetical protein SKAU_G00065540 [Synaphobranchus kaupii]
MTRALRVTSNGAFRNRLITGTGKPYASDDPQWDPDHREGRCYRSALHTESSKKQREDTVGVAQAKALRPSPLETRDKNPRSEVIHLRRVHWGGSSNVGVAQG